jgi:coenzyme F420-reducing hydrogenase delta subunit
MARMPLIKKVLEGFGLEPGRFRHEWVSAAEGEKFTNIVREMTEQVRALGPLNWDKKLYERGVNHGMDLEAWGE